MASGLGGSELGGRGLCGRAGMEVGGMMEVVGGLIIFSATALALCIVWWISHGVTIEEYIAQIEEHRKLFETTKEREEGE